MTNEGATVHMNSITTTVKASDVAWETEDGITYGYVTVGDADFDITISERVNYTKWTSASNTRAWALSATYDNTQFACGEAEGLRNSKRDALAALNAHLK